MSRRVLHHDGEHLIVDLPIAKTLTAGYSRLHSGSHMTQAPPPSKSITAPRIVSSLPNAYNPTPLVLTAGRSPPLPCNGSPEPSPDDPQSGIPTQLSTCPRSQALGSTEKESSGRNREPNHVGRPSPELHGPGRNPSAGWLLSPREDFPSLPPPAQSDKPYHKAVRDMT